MNQIDATDAKLATHEEICALRYEAIQKSFEDGTVFVNVFAERKA